jgi:glycosyltransferase involved in cell wall biosynthesis
LQVGLNLIFLLPGETGGMEVYARELLGAIAAIAPPEMRFVSFVGREAAREGGPWRDLGPVVALPVRSSRRAEWVGGEQLLLPPLAWSRRADVVHSLASTAPAWGPFRRVTTVHDLIYRHHPEAHSRLLLQGMRVLVPLAVRRSARIIADSEATKRDLVEMLGADTRRIDVIPLGFAAPAAGASLPEGVVRERFGLGERRVLLGLSAKRPHKNIGTLLEALALLPERPVLVLAGYHTPWERELRARAEALGVAEDVRWPAWLGADEVETLWRMTAGFVFPSLHEGFGLPLLEAMTRGVAIACSNTSSLPEVAGDAAILFDPRDPRAIAGAIAELLAGGERVERLRRLGPARAAAFTWERTARATLESYRRALVA